MALNTPFVVQRHLKDIKFSAVLDYEERNSFPCLSEGAMKLTAEFKKFLKDTVNLNQTRLDKLNERSEVLKNFLLLSDFAPTISTFIEQGSWAHDTIIKPVDGGEFDADLLVKVRSVDGWAAKDYVNDLARVFRNSERYKDKIKVDDVCVTVIYADDCKIDIAPLVMNREEQGKLEVCSRAEDEFIESRPIEYTEWIRERNSYSGSNSFRKSTRLIKYIRDIKGRFSCPSVLLTTLIGHRIEWWDKDTAAFQDTPTALQTILARLDDWLQANPVKPVVKNPSLESEDFATLWTDTQYLNFRNFVNKYRGWIDDAVASPSREESIEKWRRVFGDDFAKDEPVRKSTQSASVSANTYLRAGAAHLNEFVNLVVDYGVSVIPPAFRNIPHQAQPSWIVAEQTFKNVLVSAQYAKTRSSSRLHRIQDGEPIPPRGGVWFDVRVEKFFPIPQEYYVRWRITNTGVVALALKKGRGDFYSPTEGVRRWEGLEYRGVHLAEAFIVRRSDNRLVGVSDPFHVVIK